MATISFKCNETEFLHCLERVDQFDKMASDRSRIRVKKVEGNQEKYTFDIKAKPSWFWLILEILHLYKPKNEQKKFIKTCFKEFLSENFELTVSHWGKVVALVDKLVRFKLFAQTERPEDKLLRELEHSHQPTNDKIQLTDIKISLSEKTKKACQEWSWKISGPHFFELYNKRIKEINGFTIGSQNEQIALFMKQSFDSGNSIIGVYIHKNQFEYHVECGAHIDPFYQKPEKEISKRMEPKFDRNLKAIRIGYFPINFIQNCSQHLRHNPKSYVKICLQLSALGRKGQ